MISIEELYNIYNSHPIISTDTRNITRNSLFFALKGDHFNGNDFAKKALENGASFAICDEKTESDSRIIRVENVLKTLQELSIYHRNTLKIPIIGITGTNGKTTTKELLYTILKTKYSVLATLGNLNNHIGVPLTLLSITNQHEMAIIEMGANHIGEIADLCEISKPTHGIITNIGKAHLEGFGSIEGVIQTKRALYDYVINKHGKLIVDSDNELLMSLSENTDRFLYGENSGNIIGKISINAPQISVLVEEKNTQINTQLVGSYNLKNILAAIATGRLFNIDIKTIANALSSYQPQNNRSQLIKGKDNTIIMDAYNANPSSMNESLNNLQNISHNNKVLILGDMLELGTESIKEHQKIIDKIKKMELSQCILIGECFFKFPKTATINTFQNTSDAILFLEKNPILKALILVKGSRGLKLEKILPHIHKS
ncbi:MAG: UDP-N-acetylmuramoyl-tripeptide--D-alanyl-D-alanine ligase [Bacteroidales bacterium]|nr:UDP-N-acetylmuramoyl-tripeptide--D-alanyl-D-alanine ligase [Bacteroidales bacterium]